MKTLPSELYIVASGPLAAPPEEELASDDPSQEEAERAIAKNVKEKRATPETHHP